MGTWKSPAFSSLSSWMTLEFCPPKVNQREIFSLGMVEVGETTWIAKPSLINRGVQCSSKHAGWHPVYIHPDRFQAQVGCIWYLLHIFCCRVFWISVLFISCTVFFFTLLSFSLFSLYCKPPRVGLEWGDTEVDLVNQPINSQQQQPKEKRMHFPV